MTHRRPKGMLSRTLTMLTVLCAAFAVLLSGLGTAPKAYASTGAPAASVASSVAANPAATSPTPDASASELQGKVALTKPKALSVSGISAPQFLAAIPITSCTKQPPPAVQWGDDQSLFCFSSSGAVWANPVAPGSDNMPRHAPYKCALVANPATMPQIIGQVYGTNTSTGKAQYRNMTVKKNVAPPAGYPGVDPTAKVNVACYSSTGMKVLGGWLIEPPIGYTETARTVAYWTSAGNRVWIKGSRPTLYGNSASPLVTPKFNTTKQAYCSVTVRGVLDWATYPTATEHVRFYNAKGVKETLALKRVTGGTNVQLTVTIRCQSTKAKAAAQVLATRIQLI